MTTWYQQEIPWGAAINILELPTGGWFNNVLFANIFGEGRTCGSYQNYVMDFLDSVRTSTDPEVRNMLNGYDYGPIQTNGGGHVAVVVFPSGTDWHETGMVYDPWPTQKPMAYDIDTWFLALGLYAYSGYYPEPSFGSENLYPHLSGKPASYPAQSDLDLKLALPVKQILVINSPVTVMVELEDGRQVGVTPNSGSYNQAPQEVSFYTLPKDNGEHSWFFMLPDEAANVTLFGQNEGTVHIALVMEDRIESYGPQNISQYEAAEFSINDNSNLGTLHFESGITVEPFQVSQDDFSKVIGLTEAETEIDILPPQVKPTPSLFNETARNNGRNSDYLTVLCVGLCCCLIVIIIVVVTIILITRSRKKRSNSPVYPQQPYPPAFS